MQCKLGFPYPIMPVWAAICLDVGHASQFHVALAQRNELTEKPGCSRAWGGIAPPYTGEAISAPDMIRHRQPHQRACHQVRLYDGQRHVAPADAFAQQRMLRPKV